ncbi:MAG: sporulation protein YqfD [Clostridia bacterium]|nr:sporulation protein YqfD [Clostridia bacterium]
MLMLRLWNYIRGYVIILVEGYFLEKFINICIRRQIFLWDIERKKSSVMVLKVSTKGFKMIRPIVKKTKCRVKILKKRGMPFVLNRYRKRKAFVVGAFVFVALFYCLTSFIWSIEVHGNKKMDSQYIIDKLASCGVKTGVLKYNIDTDKLVDKMMLDMKELAWVGVVLKGTKIKIEVVERVQPPKLVPKDRPCNIVAGKDGVIKSVIAKAGQDMVKAGDTITKGQLLVSGSVENKNPEIPPKQVHAIAKVNARTWYEKSCPVNIKRVEKERTGKAKDHYSLVLFTKRINLFRGKISFENYDKIEIKKRLSIGEDLVFPFELIIDRHYENNLVEQEVSLDQAKSEAADEAYKEVSKEIPENAEIVKTDINYIENEDGTMKANVIVECLEDIGVEEEIGGN